MPHPTFSETRTWTGSGVGRFNEDYAVLDAAVGHAVLVDGATGLTKANLVAGESDASWFARELATRTAALLADTEKRTAVALAQAGKDVATDYLQLPGALTLNREDLPNGSVAVLRWSSTQLEVTMLGDCTAVVILRDGSDVVVHDATLDALDQQNYARMYRYAKRNHATMAEARRAVNNHFIANRLKMNEPGGYWAADITCRGYGHELVRRFALDEVAGVFACSDGFIAAVDMGVCDDAATVARRVLAGEGEQLADALREAEQDDAGCLRVHRSKTSDDATYVAVSFE